MQQLTNTLDKIIYSYDPGEFMPIFENGELSNRGQFVAYKLGRIVNRFVSR